MRSPTGGGKTSDPDRKRKSKSPKGAATAKKPPKRPISPTTLDAVSAVTGMSKKKEEEEIHLFTLADLEGMNMKDFKKVAHYKFKPEQFIYDSEED